MGKLFAVSGTHGTGKSTILNGVSDNSDIYVDSFKVSRSVQSAFGYENLNEAYETSRKMMAFQNAIIEEKYSSDKNIIKSHSTSITERSMLDVFAYAHQWCRRLDLTNENHIDKCVMWGWLYGEYYTKCLGYARELYTGIIFVHPCCAVKFQEDPNRADIESRLFVHDSIQKSIDQCSKINKTSQNLRVLNITTADPQIRIQSTIEFMEA